MIVSNQVKTDDGSFEVETEVKIVEKNYGVRSEQTTHTIILHQKGGPVAPGTSLLQCTREELVQVRRAIELALGAAK